MEELESVKNGKEKEVPATDKFNKTIIIPVAIPGCGKTSVSLALAHIFGFGHTQSDDVHIKKPAPVFIKNVVDLLYKHDVVIADKNNHLKQHRESLREATSKFRQPVRLLALNWSLDQPHATIHRICGDRVQQRGDNHQTLRADSSSKSHEEIIWTFINNTQELTPSEVDNVVEMELGESLEDSVKRAVKGCVAVMGLEMPSDEKIQEGLNIVKGYAPKVKKPDDRNEKKKINARYYGLLPEVDLEDLLDRALANEQESVKDFWTYLKTEHRVTKRPHVTFVHKGNMAAERDLWDRCAAQVSKAISPSFKGTLRNLVWDGRVMAITVEDFDVEAEGSSESNEGREFVDQLPNDTRSRLHITVGTRNPGIKPVEAKTMIEKWRRGEEVDKIKSFKFVDQTVYGRIKGLTA